MQFIDFIKYPNRKILFENNLSDGNSIIKAFSLSNKMSISNYEIFNINLLCKSILSTKAGCKYINNEEATYLFYSFLSNKKNGGDIYNLIPDSSFSFESAKVCLSTINEIRKGKRKETKNDDIDNLIKDYENYLLSYSYYDDALMLKEAIKISDSNLIKNILKIKDKFVVGIVDSYLKELSYLERLFLDTIVNKLNTSYETLTLFTINKDIKIKSYKTYGFYQEVENVINVINQNKLSVSDIEIVISNDSYINNIKAYFDNYNIPYSFSNGTALQCFDIYGLIDSIIDFYHNHYSISYLFDIYRNIAIKDEYKNIKELKNLHAYDKDILYVINNLDKETKYGKQIIKWNDNQKIFINDLLNLDKSNNVYELYISILKFVKKYCDNKYIELVIDTLNSKIKMFELCASLNIKDDKYDLIRRVLENVKVNNDKSFNSPIVIRKLSHINHLFKKHVFILGLSSSQLKQKEVESPLLSDEDLSNYIDVDNYYVELASKRNIRFNELLDRLITNNSCSNVYLSYSEYDSNEYKSLSPSSFYNKYLIKEEVSLVNSKLSLNTNVVNDNDEKIMNDTSFNKIKDNKYFSPSSLNTLYNCPLNYLYSKYYDEVSLNEYTDTWLGLNESGSLVHKILENYYNKHKDKLFDKSSFEEIFKLTCDEEIIKHPFDNDVQIESELNNIHKVVEQYLSKPIVDSDKGFKVLGCEIKFSNLKVTLNNDDSYIFAGSVDRADYYLDPATKTLKIKIYDYKTGKEKDLSNDGLTQSFIYILAIKEYLKSDEAKSIIGDFDINNVTYEFHYIYLFFNIDNCYTEESSKTNKEANEAKLLEFSLLKNSYSSFIDIYKPKLGKQNSDTRSMCVYCNYKDKCLLKRKYALNMFWDK